MKQYEMFELEFKGDAPADSLVCVDVQAEFTCDGETKIVKGFYAGNNIYKVRFYPSQPGSYEWCVSGLVHGCGTEECEQATGGHGMVKAAGQHFTYEDETPYYPFGTTIYALVHQEPELVEKTMRTLAASPFNKVRMCLFPKHYDYNNNEPELFAFEKTDGHFDVHKPCFEFWEMLEHNILKLNHMGIQCDLILFHPYDHWGFSELSKEACMTYLDYSVRRLSALPNVWWSLANEYDLMEHFERSWWDDFARFIGENDSNGHLLSNHNWMTYWDFDNPYTTHCCIQGGNVGDIAKLKRKHNKPVIFDECGYEGNLPYSWGNLSAFELVHRIWTAVAGGGYCTHGETFANDEEILWWSKGGSLHGKSPKRIEFLRGIVEALPGPLTAVTDGFWDFSPERIEALKNDPVAWENLGNVGRCLAQLPPERLEALAAGMQVLSARCGEDAYLRYYGRQCVGNAVLKLPQDISYKVEVIDAWEMTREEVAYGVSGEVKVALPGKEGMAVLATAL